MLVLAAALTTAVAAVHGVSERVDRTTVTAAGVHELVVAVHAGRIELVASPDGRVQVTTTRRWSVWAPSTQHRQGGGVLTLTGDCPPLGTLGITRCAVDERVAVPAGARVRVTADTGDLTATDLAAASLDVHLTRGSINALFTRPPDHILARLDAGSVRLTVPTATYAVDTAVPPHAGHVTVDVPTDPASPRQLSARVSRGDIQVRSR